MTGVSRISCTSLKPAHLYLQTPLNNNMRELFNLMNFLDPQEWHDLENLEKEHEELNEELVKQLHNRLRPYFLRRIKSEVLQLPPKVCCHISMRAGTIPELIVPERGYCPRVHGSFTERGLPIDSEYVVGCFSHLL
jgi:hypothetical protein